MMVRGAYVPATIRPPHFCRRCLDLRAIQPNDMKMPHSLLPGRLLIAFTLSGISALVYEVIWIRLLGDLFGHTAYAIQVVLAVFFGGLAAGRFLSDRLGLPRWRAPTLYAAIGLLVGPAALPAPLAT